MDESNHTVNGKTAWPDYVMIALMAVMIFACLLFVVRSTYFIEHKHTINYSEDSVLASALQIARGHNPYSPNNINRMPYVLTPYPPLYYLLVAAVVKFTGPMFLPGRLISLLSTFGIVFIIFKIVKRETGNIYAAILGGIAYVSMPPTNGWAAAHRVDNLAIFLAVTALYIGTAHVVSRRNMVITLLLLVASVFTKQSSVAVFVILTGLLWRQDKRRAAWFAGGYFIIVFILFSNLYLISNGGYAFHTIGSLNMNRISWDRFYSLTLAQYSNAKALFILLLIFFSVPAGFKKADRWVCYAGLAFAQGLLAIGKVGSSTNYFLEATVGFAILFGMIMAALYTKAREHKAVPLIVVSIFLTAAVFVAYAHSRSFINQHLDWIAKRAEYQKRIKLIDAVEQYSKPGDFLLTKRVGLALLTGRVPVMNAPFSFAILADTGRWDQSEVIEMLHAGAFPLVILDKGPQDIDNSEYLSRAMKEEVKSRYSYMGMVNTVYFYRPADQ